MKLAVNVFIDAPKEQVWKVITDIDHAKDNISGIEAIEILERPETGLVGLKWRETRTLFGKTATEVMWITETEENSYYKTRAESHGSIYLSTLKVEEQDQGTLLTMEFGAEIQSLFAKIMNALIGWMFVSATKKALMQDLQDIKKAVESST